MEKIILEVEDLYVDFNTSLGEVKVLQGITFSLKEGEVLAVVGESGCGKSVMARTIMKLNYAKSFQLIKGKILFDGKDIVTLSEKEMNKIRGNLISMIFQNPAVYLNPTMTIGKQISEVLVLHKGFNKKAAVSKSIKLLESLQIPDSKGILKRYPYQLSGGMCQRVMIAVSLACSPKIIIADEPTTSLDVTIQRQVINILDRIKKDLKIAIIFISHDLSVVSDISDRIAVMYAGRIVEFGTVNEIFNNAKHPYTVALLKSIPSLKTNINEKLYSIKGMPPNLLSLPEGCSFEPRCDRAIKVCGKSKPDLNEINKFHKVACYH